MHIETRRRMMEATWAIHDLASELVEDAVYLRVRFSKVKGLTLLEIVGADDLEGSDAPDSIKTELAKLNDREFLDKVTSGWERHWQGYILPISIGEPEPWTFFGDGEFEYGLAEPLDEESVGRFAAGWPQFDVAHTDVCWVIDSACKEERRLYLGRTAEREPFIRVGPIELPARDGYEAELADTTAAVDFSKAAIANELAAFDSSADPTSIDASASTIWDFFAATTGAVESL